MTFKLKLLGLSLLNPNPNEPEVQFLRWDEGLAIIICSDVRFGATRAAGGNPPNIIQCLGANPDGPSFDPFWEVETTDGRTARFSVDGREFDLSKGAMFIVTTKNGKAEVTQLRRDLSAVPIHGVSLARSLEGFLAKDPDVRKTWPDHSLAGLQELNGHWAIVSLAVGGKSKEDRGTYVFENGKVTFQIVTDKQTTRQFTVDVPLERMRSFSGLGTGEILTRNTEKWIDIEGPAAGEIVEGTYERKGDTLRLRLAKPWKKTQEGPRDYYTTRAGGETLIELKRAKP
jgi:hypothetical protein